MKYDDAFKHMKEADTANFSVNKTHADKMNTKNNTVLKMSRQKMFSIFIITSSHYQLHQTRKKFDGHHRSTCWLN